MRFYLAAPILFLSLTGCHEDSPSNTDQVSFIGFNKESSIEEVKKTIKNDLGLDVECQISSNDECIIDTGEVNKKIKKDTVNSNIHSYSFAFRDDNITRISANYINILEDNLTSLGPKTSKTIKYLKSNGFNCPAELFNEDSSENIQSASCNNETIKLRIIYSNKQNITLTTYFDKK